VHFLEEIIKKYQHSKKQKNALDDKALFIDLALETKKSSFDDFFVVLNIINIPVCK